MAKKSASAKSAKKSERKPRKSTSKKKQRASESNDQANEKEKFPGYPHYSASEDIMSQGKGEERAPADIDNHAGEFMVSTNIGTNGRNLAFCFMPRSGPWH